MVVLRKPVGFVAHILQQSKRERVSAQSKRFFLPRQIDFFFAFGKRYQDRGCQIAIAKRGQRGIELAFASVDHEQVRECVFLDGHPAKTSRNDFMDRTEIVDPFDPLDLVASVAGFEGQAIEELDQ